jgi:conjugal transfer/type IV secretion protein DotA/TraY
MWRIARCLSLSLLLFAGVASASMLSEMQAGLYAQRANQGELTPDVKSPDSMMVAALGVPMAQIDDGLSRLAEGESPMLVLQHIGQSALGAYSMLYAIVSAPNMTVTQAVMKPIYFVAGVFLLTVGFMLGILVPFVPLLIFVTGALFWLVHLVVGVTGAPVWVFFCITGDDQRRRQYGEILVSSLMDTVLRPSLMVLGFFSAGLMASALLKLVFMFVLPSVFGALPVSFIGILAKLVILMLVARICLSVVINSFSLILLMPNAVMEFLGVTQNKIRMAMAKGVI